MKTTLYTYINGERVSVSGRTPPNNPYRNDQRYEKLLLNRGLFIEGVQTYMLVEDDEKDVLFAYSFTPLGWILSANTGKQTVSYGPMSIEESREETVKICRSLKLI
jgi:hypothetical protein